MAGIAKPLLLWVAQERYSRHVWHVPDMPDAIIANHIGIALLY